MQFLRRAFCCARKSNRSRRRRKRRLLQRSPRTRQYHSRAQRFDRLLSLSEKRLTLMIPSLIRSCSMRCNRCSSNGNSWWCCPWRKNFTFNHRRAKRKWNWRSSLARMNSSWPTKVSSISMGWDIGVQPRGEIVFFLYSSLCLFFVHFSDTLFIFFFGISAEREREKLVRSQQRKENIFFLLDSPESNWCRSHLQARRRCRAMLHRLLIHWHRCFIRWPKSIRSRLWCNDLSIYAFTIRSNRMIWHRLRRRHHQPIRNIRRNWFEIWSRN